MQQPPPQYTCDGMNGEGRDDAGSTAAAVKFTHSGQHYAICLLLETHTKHEHSTSVFFNLFFEVEPFAAILIAHRTHGLSHEFVLGSLMSYEGPILEAKAESGEGVLGEQQ